MRYYKTKLKKILGSYSTSQILEVGEKEFAFATDLLSYHFDDNNDLIDDTTQEQIDELAEAEVDRLIEVDLDTKEQDGEAFFKKVRNLIRKHYNLGNINNNQYKSIRVTLQPALQPLRYGDWDVSQDNINAISRPSGNLSVLYDFLKNKIDIYVTDNY